MLYPISNPAQDLFAPGSTNLRLILPKRVWRHWVSLASVKESHTVRITEN